MTFNGAICSKGSTTSVPADSTSSGYTISGDSYVSSSRLYGLEKSGNNSCTSGILQGSFCIVDTTATAQPICDSGVFSSEYGKCISPLGRVCN